MNQGKVRCAWVGNDWAYIAYHDREWGVPVRDDRSLFEFLILEGAQAGLSWLTILKRREGYRKAFNAFSVGEVAAYGEQDINRLRADGGIIRNKLKINAAIGNARGVLDLQKEYGSFYSYLCQFATDEAHGFREEKEIPTFTESAVRLSKDLKKRGFRFVGPTIMYAFMQAVGMRNDHCMQCFRYQEIARMPSFIQA